MIKFALCDDNVQVLSKLKEMLEKIFLKYDPSQCSVPPLPAG